MRPQLVLFAGVRSIPVADLCRPLTTLADVTVATSRNILEQRPDRHEDTAGARHTIVAASSDEIVADVVGFAGRHRVDGVLTFSEDLVEATARCAAALGLPGQPVATIAGLRDKYAQRRALADHGVPVPPFCLVDGPEDAGAALLAVPLPAILKPNRGSGGALTYLINAPDQLEPVLREASGYLRQGMGAVEDGAFILEGLLVGRDSHDIAGFAPYVSVESVATAGRLIHLGVTDRFPPSPPALETGFMLPSALAADLQEELMSAAGQALRALDFRNGLAHTEFMLTADGPRVIEVNARAGGCLPYLFPMASDVDLVVQAGRVALGLAPAEQANFTGHALFVTPQHPVGVEVVKVRGLDEVAALPGVRLVIPLSVGGNRTDGFQHTLVAAILAMTSTPGEAVRLWRNVMALVRPEYGPPSTEK